MSEAKSGTSGLDVCSAAIGSMGHNLAVSRSIHRPPPKRSGQLSLLEGHNPDVASLIRATR
jgi:hypothetical protein